MNMCRFCGTRRAELPDRYRMGSSKRVCRECHANRLREDVCRILEAEKRRRGEEEVAE